jgi:hypothetical protein
MSSKETTKVEIKFITEHERISGEVEVWAVPVDQYTAEETGRLFEYEIRTYRSFDDGAVKVCTDTITVDVPGGINLIEKAIETLDEKAAEHLKEYQEALKEIEHKKSQLLMLTHIEPEEV